jgi:hypothetical protein
VERRVAVYGIPEVFLTDNGSKFASRFFNIVITILGIYQVFTTAYHPSTNGQAEWINAVIADAITHYISKQEEWDEYSATTTFAYNNTVHSTTGFTPFELVLSRTPSVLSVNANEYANLATSRCQKLNTVTNFSDELKDSHVLHGRLFKNVPLGIRKCLTDICGREKILT